MLGFTEQGIYFIRVAGLLIGSAFSDDTPNATPYELSYKIYLGTRYFRLVFHKVYHLEGNPHAFLQGEYERTGVLPLPSPG